MSGASGQPYMASSCSQTSSLRLDHLSSAKRTPRFVIALACFSAIGGFLFGYDTGVISGAMIQLRDRFQLNSVWQEMIVSVTLGAAAIFALIGQSCTRARDHALTSPCHVFLLLLLF